MLVNNKVLDEENVMFLIEDIRKKKELRELSEEFIREHLLKYLQQETKITYSLISNFNRKSSYYRKLVKELRSRLRRLYGLFRVEEEAKRREELVEELMDVTKKDRKGIIDEILKTHSSTRERLSFYDELYKKIFLMTGKPECIIDLGCGINPFSIHYMRLNKLNYYAYDLSIEEIDSLNRYFNLVHKENKSFKGKAEILDVMHWVKLSKLGTADICFLFKMTDVLDMGRGHKVTETIVKNVPARYVAVSFPTKTMSGKKMNFPRRKWIELMCRRLGYKFKIIEFSNEIFYIIQKLNGLLMPNLDYYSCLDHKPA